jgi:DNA primase
MSSFVDFAAIKEAVSFSAAIDLLELPLKQSGTQWRGACPACEGGGPRALVVTEGKGFYCFALKKGGDQIALAAHVLGVSVKDAAQDLAERAGLTPRHGTVPSTSTVKGTVPQSDRAKETEKFQALSYLEHDHDAVHAVGFDPTVAERFGIGYAPKGIMRGTVAVPIRDEDGVLHGYIGITEATLPADFQTNVVKLTKRA